MGGSDTEWQTEAVEGFFRYRLAVGTIVEAAVNEKARKPAYRLIIDFGPLGLKQSSAQLTLRYAPHELVGRQVVAVTNFPPKHIAGVRSDVLVLGAMPSAQDVILLAPDVPVENGTLIG